MKNKPNFIVIAFVIVIFIIAFVYFNDRLDKIEIALKTSNCNFSLTNNYNSQLVQIENVIGNENVFGDNNKIVKYKN